MAVEEVKRVLVENCCNLNVVTYGIVVNGLCGDGLIDYALYALEVKRSMVEEGILTSSHIYSILINGFCREKRFADADSLFKELIDEGQKPDVVVCNVFFL